MAVAAAVKGAKLFGRLNLIVNHVRSNKGGGSGFFICGDAGHGMVVSDTHIITVTKDGTITSYSRDGDDTIFEYDHVRDTWKDTKNGAFAEFSRIKACIDNKNTKDTKQNLSVASDIRNYDLNDSVDTVSRGGSNSSKENEASLDP